MQFGRVLIRNQHLRVSQKILLRPHPQIYCCELLFAADCRKVCSPRSTRGVFVSKSCRPWMARLAWERKKESPMFRQWFGRSREIAPAFRRFGPPNEWHVVFL